MMLIELKGDVEKKMAVSGGLRFERLKDSIPSNANSTKTLYFMIRRLARTKIIAMTSTIKEVHDKYKDNDGYLRIYVKGEASF